MLGTQSADIDTFYGKTRKRTYPVLHVDSSLINATPAVEVIPIEPPQPQPSGSRLYAYCRTLTSQGGQAWVTWTDDGITWDSTFIGIPIVIDFTWGKHYISGKPDGSKLVITGGLSNGMMTSTDNALTWTAVPELPENTILAPALWTGSRWIFGRGSLWSMDDNNSNITTVLSSTGGNGFDIKQNPTTKTILHCGGQGGGNYCWRSTDNGETWTRTGFGIMADYWRGLVYSPFLNLWIGFGTGCITRSTDDGLTWSPWNQPPGWDIQAEGVSWDSEGNQFLAAHRNGYSASFDGINWTLYTVGGLTEWCQITKFKGRFFGRYYNGSAWTIGTADSLSGSWTSIPFPFSISFPRGFFITSG